MLQKCNYVVGLDLGNLNSRIAVYRNENVKIIPNRQGNPSTPSVVSFTNEVCLIGDQALDKININPQNTVYSLKQLINLDFNEVRIINENRQRNFKIVNKTNKPMIRIDFENETRIFDFEEILAMIMLNLKESAETFLKEQVCQAVISFPDFFNLFQIKSIENAAKIAGLDIVSLICDTAATSVLYSFKTNFAENKNVFFFDLGSGSLKLSIIKIKKRISEVQTRTGGKNLGGDEFDIRLLKYCIRQFYQKFNLDISKSSKSVERLRKECEKAKRFLSTNSETRIQIDSLYHDKDFLIDIKRKLFEELCEDLFQEIGEKLNELFKISQIKKTSIDNIVVVGGSSRIPRIEKIIKNFFDRSEIDKRLNKDEAVVSGSALYAATFFKSSIDKFLVRDQTPLSIGTLGTDNSEILELNTEKFNSTEINSMRRNNLKYKHEYNMYEEKQNLKNELEERCIEAIKLRPLKRDMYERFLNWLIQYPSAENGEYRKKIQLVRNSLYSN